MPYGSSALELTGFEVLTLVGRGTFAEVWQVRHRDSGRLFALKCLREDSPNPQVGRTLLQNEAEVARRVRSEHVVRVVDAEPAGVAPFLRLEWLTGETLESRLQRRRWLSCRETLWIARQIAQGLADLLAAGFSHGDVKPANIFLCDDGLVKLLDLGFAQPDRALPIDFADPPPLLSGTPEYLAPELLARGEQPAFARDLYSLGVTLFRMLTGTLPFQGRTVAEVLREQQQALPPRLRSRAPHVPPAVEQLVHRLLSKQPLRRGENLRRLVRELVALELETLDRAV